MMLQIKNPMHMTQQYPYHIKSFVKRARHLSTKRQQIVNALSAIYVLETQNGLLDYNKIYKIQAPVILEIGFGMGDTLWQMAKNQPEKNFLGIEVHQPGIARLLEKLQIAPLHNIKIYNSDALIVLKQCIPDNSLDQILLFFPDPWPKRRQHKRRIIQIAFIQLIYNKLKAQGIFHMRTDCQDYAEHSLKILKQTLDQSHITSPVLTITTNQAKEAESAMGITKFEQRARQQGQKIYDITFTKKQ